MSELKHVPLSRTQFAMGDLPPESFSSGLSEAVTKLNFFGEEKDRPVILMGAAEWWPAVGKWTPQFFKERFAQVEIRPSLFLPTTGVPYSQTEAAHRCVTLMSDLLERMAAGERCYLDQSDISRFVGLEADYSFAWINAASVTTSLWIGSQTRSGLHYDLCDNWLVQVYGQKKALLVSPQESRCLYPFHDNVTKSQVDPETPDLGAYPRFSDARVFTGDLDPGDMLFIPRGWWHHLSTRAESISVNCWFGAPLSIAEQVRMTHSAGSSVWMRVVRDFVWHGVLRRRFRQRLYSPPPTGKMLYDMMFGKQAGP